jgi:hypothetical protein
VPRELGHPAAGPVAAQLFQRLGDAAVQTGAARRAQRVVQRVVDQVVRERERACLLGALEHQRRLDRPVQHVDEPVLVRVHDAHEQLEVEVAADDGGARQHVPAVLAEALDPPVDDLAHALRQAQRVELADELPAAVRRPHDRTRLREVAQDLAHEERVAVGLSRDLARERQPRRVQLVTGRVLHQRDDRGLAQTAQGQPPDALLAAQVGEDIHERVIARDVAVAVGRHDEQRDAVRLGDHVAQQRERRPVGPLQVVEEQDERRRGAELGEQADHGRVQQPALRLGIGLRGRLDVGYAAGQRRHQPRELAAVALGV